MRETSTVTLRGRGRTSVAGASVPLPDAERLPLHYLGVVCWNLDCADVSFLFPCLEDGAVSIVREKLGVEKGKDVGERRWAPSKAVIRRTTVAAAAAILYTCLAAGVLSEEGCPQGQFIVESMVCYSTNNRVILVIEGPDAIIDAEGVPTRVNR